MATHYLLPCQCGQKTEIDSSQAGLTVRCACGTELAVPAMRGLAGLERVERAPPPSQARAASTWGPRQGIMFLGAAIVVAAGLVAVYFWLMLPNQVTLKEDYRALNRDDVNQLTLEQTIDRWHELRAGIESPMDEMRLAVLDAYADRVMEWITLCGGVAGIGCLLIVVGLFIPRRQGLGVGR